MNLENFQRKKNHNIVGISMGRHLRQNDANTSEIYIGRPICISDFQYKYRTSDSDIRYLYRTSDIQHPTLARARARVRARARDRARVRARAGISHVGYRYRISDIGIGRRIYILDVRHIYWMSDIHIGRPIYV